MSVNNVTDTEEDLVAWYFYFPHPETEAIGLLIHDVEFVRDNAEAAKEKATAMLAEFDLELIIVVRISGDAPPGIVLSFHEVQIVRR